MCTILIYNAAGGSRVEGSISWIFFYSQVAHMTKSEMHLHDTAFIGPALLFLDQYFNSFIDEYIVLWIALVFSFFDLIRYCVSVCNQIASHLHIHVFRIKTSTAHSNHH